MIGMNHSSCHQPLRSVSCRRRAPTASEGSSVASENRPEAERLSALIAKLTRNMNSQYHQYSGRFARPLKSAYLLKQVLIASVKPMIAPFIFMPTSRHCPRENHDT